MLPRGLRLVASRGCGHGCSARVVTRAGIRSLGTWANTQGQGDSYSQPLDMAPGQPTTGATATVLQAGPADMPLPAGLSRVTSDAVNVPHVVEKLLKAAGGDARSDGVRDKAIKAGKEARIFSFDNVKDFESAERIVLEMEKTNDYSRLYDLLAREDISGSDLIKKILLQHVTDKASMSGAKTLSPHSVARRLRVSFFLLSHLLENHMLLKQGEFDDEVLWPFFRGCAAVGSGLAPELLTQMQAYARTANQDHHASGGSEQARGQRRHRPLRVPEGLVGLTIAACFRKGLRKVALDLYRKAREDGHKKTKALYVPLLQYHVENKHVVEALEVIMDAKHDVLEDHCLIPFHNIRAALELAIETQEPKIIQRLLEVIEEKYSKDYKLDRGTIRQVLNTAARWGKVEGLDKLWNLKTVVWGQVPDASDFNAVVQAYAAVRNDTLALGALNEMVCLQQQPSPGTLHFLAKQLASSVTRLDEAYDVLVRMKAAQDAAIQEGTSVLPVFTVGRPSLQAIVLGCAWANELDRAFATFEEYQSVFGLPHDVDACNALLFACQRAKTLQVGAAMSVLSEMGRLGVAPNAETYHHVIKILVQARSDKGKVEDVFQSIGEQGLEPLPQTLRCMAMYRTLIGDHQGAMAAVQALRHKSYFVPAYLTRRVTERQHENAPSILN